MGTNARIALRRQERRRSRIAALEAAGRGINDEATALRHRLGAYVAGTVDEAGGLRRWRAELEAARRTS